jgi:hypothetical protein
LKKAFPEIPPGLSFSKGGELFPRCSPKDRVFPHLKKQNEGRLPAFQSAKKIRFLRIEELVKSRNSIESVIPANRGSGPGQALESSYFKMFWTPAFAGVTLQETFYETIRIRRRNLW